MEESYESDLMGLNVTKVVPIPVNSPKCFYHATTLDNKRKPRETLEDYSDKTVEPLFFRSLEDVAEAFENFLEQKSVIVEGGITDFNLYYLSDPSKDEFQGGYTDYFGSILNKQISETEQIELIGLIEARLRPKFDKYKQSSS